jgi:PAS domain S-box-containing protein
MDLTSPSPLVEPSVSDPRIDFLASIIDSLEDAIFAKDLNGIIKSWNAAAERLFGYPAAEVVGRNVSMLIPSNLRFEEDEILNRIRRAERIKPLVTTRQRKDGSLVEVGLTISLLKSGDGKATGAVTIARDNSEHRRKERLLERYQNRYELLHRIAKSLSSDLDLERIVDVTVAAATNATGAKFGAFFYNVLDEKGESYLLYALSGAPREAFAKFGMPRNTAVFDHTFKGIGTVRSDDIRQDPRYGKNPPHYGQPAGHLPVVSYLAVPVKSRTGHVIGGLFFGHERPGVFDEAAQDIAEEIAAIAGLTVENARLHDAAAKEIGRRKKAEETKELLLHEIKHRVKNMLATMEVIASQSLRNLPGEDRRSFIARIRALAGAHDLLTSNDWSHVDLQEIIERCVEGFDDAQASRFDVTGPSIKLEPSKAMLMALTLHELAMNALKYGALSSDEGRVEIAWDLVEPEHQVHLLWQERGGPHVPGEPKHHGFGSTLIQKALQGGGGGAILKFEADGVTCAIHMPV